MKSFSQQDADDVRKARDEAYSSSTPYEFLQRLSDLADRLEREANRYVIVEDK